MSSFEQFIQENNKLIYSIVENSKRKYMSNRFHKFLLEYYDKDDVYQELITKLHSIYGTYDDNISKHTTYFTNVCINHLYTLMQPYKAQKKQGKDIKTIDLKNFVDEVDYKELYHNKLTLQEIRGFISTHKNKDILYTLLDGYNQSDVARMFNVSRQHISKVYLAFIDEM
jgi:RNA polymerase sigma factor (sigma-70 family)